MQIKVVEKPFNKTLLVALTVGLFGVAGCSGGTTNQADNVRVDNPDVNTSVKIYKNGDIYTVNPNQPWAEAIVIDDGIIAFVGSDAAATSYEINGAEVIDLNGKMIMPGFHDVHVHALESASESNHFSLDTKETNPENFINTIRQASTNNPNAPWLIGYGHDIYSLINASRDPVDILDDAVSDRPVIVMEQTSHSMWVNSKALERAGINRNSANPVGGLIMKNSNTGDLNGILIDNAGDLVMDIAMAPTATILQNDYLGLVEYTLPEFAKNGITSFTDARAYWKRDHHKTWQKIEQNNLLTARVALALWAYPEDDDRSQIEALKQLYSNQENSLLKINQIKIYSDGIVSNTTAAMHTPYLFDILGIDGNRGLNYFTQERISNYITELEPAGFDFHIHTIGERGIFESLNAIETSGTDTGRHRLTHLEIVSPSDLTRFSDLNVTADCQVAGDFSKPEHWNELVEFVGVEKADNQIPLRSFKNAGARVTLSSDWSVSPFNPFIGLQNAITRAPQNLTLEEAVRAYTLDAAYVMRQEDKVGSLEVGKEADLIILDRNIFEVEQNTIHQTQVLKTLLAGKVVFGQ